MKIFVSTAGSGIVIPRNIKKDAKKQVLLEITKKLGWHVSSLEEIYITHPANTKINGFSIYREIKASDPETFKQMDPQKIFEGQIHWGKTYFFGIVETKKPRKTFVFLAEIPAPLPVGKERILLDELQTVKVIVKPV